MKYHDIEMASLSKSNLSENVPPLQYYLPQAQMVATAIYLELRSPGGVLSPFRNAYGSSPWISEWN